MASEKLIWPPVWDAAAIEARTRLPLSPQEFRVFDCVLWRSLLNAPAPEDLFSYILGVLSEHDRSADSSPNQRLDDILKCLQDRRCLVILDNVEAVLRPGDPTMRYREDYERYGELFELVAKTTHQSCLLLTSREKPRAIANALVRKRADFITALEQDCFHQGFLIKLRKVTQVILILN